LLLLPDLFPIPRLQLLAGSLKESDMDLLGSGPTDAATKPNLCGLSHKSDLCRWYKNDRFVTQVCFPNSLSPIEIDIANLRKHSGLGFDQGFIGEGLLDLRLTVRGLHDAHGRFTTILYNSMLNLRVDP